jgi:catalase-peroxidase
MAAAAMTLASFSQMSAASMPKEAKANQFWWPEQLNLTPLRSHDDRSNPYGADFNYAEAFKSLDLDAVKEDIEKILTTSQPWWPADYGHYGPFMIRMAWHSAGTYRVGDGRGGAGGGQQRFDPLNSWPDNASLDKARRLLWPVKQKYGRNLSWADLMILAGNVALESSGFETFGFAGGRADDWEPDVVYWGPEQKMLDDKRRTKDGKQLKGDLAAIQMGLIYVNPEGPNGNHQALAAAEDMRLSFGRMAMNDEEIVALVAGGHTLGKAHGAHKPDKCVGAEPGAAGVEEQGFGWKNKCGKGHSEDTVTSGLEGAWTQTPTAWSILYLSNLLNFEWEMTKSPAGATQWIPKNGMLANTVPDAHIPNKRHAPIMFTTDMALKEDPEFRKISERFLKDPKQFDLAFAKAWFKLTHRDMGPRARYVGSEVPAEVLLWQDPIPEADYKMIRDKDAKKLKSEILDSGLSVSELVRTAWASAASFRYTDMRGGANGARVSLEPQVNWAVNNPEELNKVLNKLKAIQTEFNEKSGKRQVSLADLIVLGGVAAIEQAAKAADVKVEVPFTPGRTDATQAQTDVKSFAVLEPKADPFRNYYSKDSFYAPAEAMVDRANLLNLTVPELTVLVGGMRALDANTAGSKHGVLTDKPGVLTNDFFVNLLDMSTKWTKSKSEEGVYQGLDRESGKLKYTATTVDLLFGSNTELRAVAEVYAANDGKEKFVQDFVSAWTKVMNADRFDLKQ